MTPEIIDVHTHFFVKRSFGPELARGLGELRKAGVTRIVSVGLINERLSVSDAASVMPDFVKTLGDPGYDETDDILGLARDLFPMLIPFVDMRHLKGDVGLELTRRIGQGFRGIKGIYVPDENNDLKVRPLPEALGITLDQYREREWETFRFAEENNLPILYHMDAKRYGADMEALLSDFPRARILIPHLGISRKAFERVLNRHPNVFTDFASLLGHMRREPEGYGSFFSTWQDNVCFGTDAVLYRVEEIMDYARFIEGMGLPGEVVKKMCSENPRRFLGEALTGK